MYEKWGSGMKFDFEVVGKIGSIALVRKEEYDIDYNVFSRIGKDLTPDFIWVSSGAGVIGRLDYIKRNNGKEIEDISEEYVSSYYAAQGQSILMENYRRFIHPMYSVRQLLVEHQHFNEQSKKEFIRKLLVESVKHNAITIVNYNDSVSNEEIRKVELNRLRLNCDKVVELVDNDETASQISVLVKSKYLLMMTSTEGLLKDPDDDTSLIKEVNGKDVYELIDNINSLQDCCNGASRKGANGMKAKLQYLIEPIRQGTTVIIGHSKYRIKDLMEGNVNRTIFRVR